MREGGPKHQLPEVAAFWARSVMYRSVLGNGCCKQKIAGTAMLSPRMFSGPGNEQGVGGFPPTPCCPLLPEG